MRLLIVTLLTGLLLLFSGCGGLAAQSSGEFTGPNVSGTWEIVATSTSAPGNSLLMETNFAQSGSAVSATSKSILLVGFPNGGGGAGDAAYIGGLCPANGTDGITATLTNSGSLKYSLSEGGNMFSGTGVATTKTMSGTYQSGAGTCSDSGTFVGTQIPTLDQLNFSSCGNQQEPYIETAAVAEKLDHTLSLSGTYNGTPFTLSGSRLGNVMNVTGDLNGQTTHVYVYFSQGNNLFVYDEKGQWLSQLCMNYQK